MPTERKTLKRKRVKHNKHNKTIHGGKNYSSVELYYNETPVICDICNNNNYYHRDATLGRSKMASLISSQAFFAKLSMYALICNECGNTRLLKKEKAFDDNNTNFQMRQIEHTGKTKLEKKLFPIGIAAPLKI
jgi:hypothetical protein